MRTSNQNIHALWIGKKLAPTEQLTIKSFQRNGHIFHLWAYDDIETEIPEGCVIHNAADIIPRDEVFCYNYSNQFGHGKGSYAGFSDIFRYKLLYEHGGWWTDMDVTCLKPLDFEDDYVFRTHHSLPLVGNVMKCPKGSGLMLQCYQQAKEQVTAENRDWHLPIQILADNVKGLGLEKYIREFSNPDSWNLIRKLLRKNFSPPGHWYIIHWVNEEWRRNNIDKTYALKKSYFYKTAIENEVAIKRLTGKEAFKQRWKLSVGAYITKKLKWN